MAFHRYQIAVSNVQDRDAAIQQVEGLVRLVNRTWERRAEIEPSYEVRRRPGIMEVYALLPRSNCRACGQPTCFVFATKLVAVQVRLEDCPPLQEPQYARPREKLEEQFAWNMPAIR